jgi:hypothetical protein
MRLAAIIGSAMLVAAAVMASSAASDQPLRLSADKAHYKLSATRGTFARLHVAPVDEDRSRRVSLAICVNGRLDRSALANPREPRCSGLSGGAYDDRGAGIVDLFLQTAGRYEVAARRLGGENYDHLNVSNVLTFEAIGPCRLRAVRLTIPTEYHWLPGAPVECNDGGVGLAVLRGDDGSEIRLVSGRDYVAWGYDPRLLGVPVFLLSGNGTKADLSYRTGTYLGSKVIQTSTAAVMLFSTAPAGVSVRHRNGVSAVRVRRGVAVAVRIRGNELYAQIRRLCSRRPTVACLGRIRYTVGGLRKRTERAKVLRAGQSATFTYRGVR